MYCLIGESKTDHVGKLCIITSQHFYVCTLGLCMQHNIIASHFYHFNISSYISQVFTIKHFSHTTGSHAKATTVTRTADSDKYNCQVNVPHDLYPSFTPQQAGVKQTFSTYFISQLGGHLQHWEFKENLIQECEHLSSQRYTDSLRNKVHECCHWFKSLVT